MRTPTKQELKSLIKGKLRRNYGRDADDATAAHMFKACALVVRDIMAMNRVTTTDMDENLHARQVHYLSLEFLMGRSLEKNAYNLGILPQLREAVEELGFSASDLFETEPDPGLGNGGLGRLAACYLDSMTTLEIPATGYSICYELGFFKQKILDGEQVELADPWLELGGAWLIRHEEESENVHFGGSVELQWKDNGCTVVEKDYTTVLAVPMDMCIAGYGTDYVNLLRLWDAKSATPEDLSFYSTGEYLKAIEQQSMAEVISKVLYPADNHYEGKSLRLKQQYFFVSATAQSIVRQHKKLYGTLSNFHEKHVIQINDTHPALVIPELMRLLMDQEGMTWDEAWYITTHTVAYTNHTVLAEALEKWPQNLIESQLPRIWLILCEINDRYLKDLREFFHNDFSRLQEMAVIWGGEVRMANLCIAACFAVNGVSALHSDILIKDVFHSAWLRTPEKFTNVTNGVDHRRWLAESNPRLHDFIVELTGSDSYLLNPQSLEDLTAFASDSAALAKLGEIKAANKRDFAAWAAREYGFELNTNAIFDVQVKRLHEYKRQLLSAMHIIYLYQKLKNDPSFEMVPRVFLFGAKAAQSYTVAKRIIELLCSLQKAINNDPVCEGKLQVFFLENYRVTMAEKLIPAADISEQISTAGKEASGTGNMKFMMNGAVTVGTMDGANVEIRQQVGDDNIFIFGLTADEVQAKKREGYVPYSYFNNSAILQDIFHAMRMGFGDGKHYDDLARRLLLGDGSPADEYMLLADFESYRYCQERAAKAYLDTERWNRMALMNIAKSGIFAADRAVSEYAKNIWHVDMREQ